ncbi:MAG: aldehyde dehydrogenase family protein [Beijerinckiaceae bacterium]
MSVFPYLIADEVVPILKAMSNINPSDRPDIIGKYAMASREHVDMTIAASAESFQIWSRINALQCFEILDRIGTEVGARSSEIGDMLVREEVKTLKEATVEVLRAGQLFKFFAAEDYRANSKGLPSVKDQIGLTVTREPIGVVGMTTSQMTINRDEIFGPIAAIIPARDYDEALAIANDTEARLSSAIVTKSSKVIRHFRDNAESDMIQVKLPKEGVDFYAPFTGRKQAGYGPAEKGSYARDFFTVFKVTHERFM